MKSMTELAVGELCRPQRPHNHCKWERLEEEEEEEDEEEEEEEEGSDLIDNVFVMLSERDEKTRQQQLSNYFESIEAL